LYDAKADEPRAADVSLSINDNGGGDCFGVDRGCDFVGSIPSPVPLVLLIGDDEEEVDTFDLTWSHTNSSSSTNSRESGEAEAYFRIDSTSVVMYCRLASVLESPELAFHASLATVSPDLIA
jgi:hypothetical protein